MRAPFLVASFATRSSQFFVNDRKSMAALFCGGRSGTGAVVSALKICRLEAARRCLSAGADRDTHFAEKFVVPCKGKVFSVVRQTAFVGERA